MSKGKTVLYPPHGEVTFYDIAHIHERSIGKSHAYYRARWNAFGKPETVEERMFTLSTEEVRRLTGTSGFRGGCVAGIASDCRYLDPAFLPDIPFGDLAHLSNERNTGAARPEQEWR